jgi:hypothetical protein
MGTSLNAGLLHDASGKRWASNDPSIRTSLIAGHLHDERATSDGDIGTVHRAEPRA